MRKKNNKMTTYEWPFLNMNRAVLRRETTMKVQTAHFVFSFDYNNKLSDPIVGSLVRKACFLMTSCNYGEILYMEVSNKTSLLMVQLTLNAWDIASTHLFNTRSK